LVKSHTGERVREAGRSREAGMKLSTGIGTTSSLGSTVLSRRVPIKRRADPIAPPPPPETPLTERNGLRRHSTNALPTSLRYSAPTLPPLLVCANWKRRSGEANRGRPRRGQQATGSLPRGRSRGAESPGTNSIIVRGRAVAGGLATPMQRRGIDRLPRVDENE
jgi:hypothetical protein